MAGSKKNEQCIEEYIASKGRVRQSDVVEHFLRADNPDKMSRQAIFNTLERLDQAGKVVRLDGDGENRTRIFYEVPLRDDMLRARQFIQTYKNENKGTNPTLETIAVELRKSPESIRSAVYAVAKDVEWQESNAGVHYAGLGKYGGENFDKAEISLVLKELKTEKHRELAAIHLHSLYPRQDVLKYPDFLKEISAALKQNPNGNGAKRLLYVMHTLLGDGSFSARLGKDDLQEQYEGLLDVLFKITSDEKLEIEIREQAALILALRADERLIDFLVNVLEDAKPGPGGGGPIYKFRNIFDQAWGPTNLYKAHRIKLIQRMFELSNKNPYGAEVLCALINKSS